MKRLETSAESHITREGSTTMWGFRFFFFFPLSIRYTHPSVFFPFFLRQKQTARKTFILSALFFWPPLDLSPLLSCGPYGMPGGEVSCPGPQQPYMEVTRHVYGLLYSMGPAQTGRCNLCLACKSKHEPPFSHEFSQILLWTWNSEWKQESHDIRTIPEVYLFSLCYSCLCMMSG